MAAKMNATSKFLDEAHAAVVVTEWDRGASGRGWGVLNDWAVVVEPYIRGTGSVDTVEGRKAERVGGRVRSANRNTADGPSQPNQPAWRGCRGLILRGVLGTGGAAGKPLKASRRWRSKGDPCRRTRLVGLRGSTPLTSVTPQRARQLRGSGRACGEVRPSRKVCVLINSGCGTRVLLRNNVSHRPGWAKLTRHGSWRSFVKRPGWRRFRRVLTNWRGS